MRNHVGLLVFVLLAACKPEDRAHGEVRGKSAPIEIDGTKANKKIEESAKELVREVQDEVRKIGESEAAQDIKQGTEQIGRGLEKGARSAAGQAGRAIEGAGRDLQEKVRGQDAGAADSGRDAAP